MTIQPVGGFVSAGAAASGRYLRGIAPLEYEWGGLDTDDVADAIGIPVVPLDGITAATINARLQDIKAAQGSQYGGGKLTLPAGIITIDEPIVIPNHSWLDGAGVGTVIQCAPSFTDAAAIIVEGQANRFVRLTNLRLHGNKENVAGTIHGIAFDVDDVANDEYADPYWTVQDLVITDFSGKGAYTIGRGAGRADRVIIRDCDDSGWHVTAPDCAFSGLEISGSGRYGWLCEGSNTRIWGSKTFYNGNSDGSQGSGFATIGCSNVMGAACEAQDNNGNGFLAKDGDGIIWEGCLADSNNAGHNGDPDRSAAGFAYDNASYGRCTGRSYDRGLVASGNTRQQEYGLDLVNGADSLTADLKCNGNSSGHFRTASGATNLDLRINAYGGQQDVGYAASRTLDPTRGNYIRFDTLTGDITLVEPTSGNYWTGCQVTVQFRQDATGNRTVTWPANFLVGAAITAMANKRSTKTFVYNATDDLWVQVAESLNL